MNLDSGFFALHYIIHCDREMPKWLEEMAESQDDLTKEQFLTHLEANRSKQILPFIRAPFYLHSWSVSNYSLTYPLWEVSMKYVQKTFLCQGWGSHSHLLNHTFLEWKKLNAKLNELHGIRGHPNTILTLFWSFLTTYLPGKILCTFILQNLHTVNIFPTTYPSHLVNVVFWWPLIQIRMFGPAKSISIWQV